MSEATDRKEYLDRFYPFLEVGQEAPGRWVPYEAPKVGMKWQGQLGWRTRHGEAIGIWSAGKISEVENAHYPDGTRGEARNVIDHGFRRRATDSATDRLWVYGSIDVRPDDIIFSDGDQPIYAPPPLTDVPNLEADLARDSDFLAAIKNDRFAFAVSTVFSNRTFYKGKHSWELTLRQVARLIADLRGKGESYQDYYSRDPLPGVYPDDRPEREDYLQKEIKRLSKLLASDSPFGFSAENLNAFSAKKLSPAEEIELQQGMKKLHTTLEQSLEKAKHDLEALRNDHTNDDVYEALHGHLSRLGWRTETEVDRVRLRQEWMERALRVLQEVKQLEQRPAAPAKLWTEKLGVQGLLVSRGFEPGELEAMSPDVRAIETRELHRRLKNLALTGRIGESEYKDLNDRLSQNAR